MFSLADKTVVITGAGSGIGQAIALLFAKQGAHIEVLDLQLAGAQATVDQILAAGGSAHASACDVGDQEAVQAVFADISARRPRLDVLVNNAGIAHIGTVLTTGGADLDRLYRINIKGVFHCSQAAIARMVDQGGGVVLNLCSIAAQMGLADRFAYSMTKGAVLMMTYSMAKDFIKQGVRCNCICPAPILVVRRRCSRSSAKRSRSAAWPSRMRSPLWRFIFAVMKPALSPVAPIRLTVARSICAKRF
jgi:2-keto-3-deoxy-L-fuconate dehydrogenase